MSEESSPTKLTASQIARIERNRQRALLLKQARLAANPYPSKSVNLLVPLPGKAQDTGGGGFIPDDSDQLELPHTIAHSSKESVVCLDPSIKPTCLDCEKTFEESFLFTNYGHSTCDGCRDKDGKHCLITKTEALKEFLLKDCDIDKREPPLRYIVKKNPHTSRGDMKLYLRHHVEKRALEVWENEEALEEAHEKREEDRERRKQKAYEKKIKSLRMEVRSSLYRKEPKIHVHVYGQETYMEDEDIYKKTCQLCEHSITFEKM